MSPELPGPLSRIWIWTTLFAMDDVLSKPGWATFTGFQFWPSMCAALIACQAFWSRLMKTCCKLDRICQMDLKIGDE
jgi:hypothetical protein